MVPAKLGTVGNVEDETLAGWLPLKPFANEGQRRAA